MKWRKRHTCVSAPATWQLPPGTTPSISSTTAAVVRSWSSPPVDTNKTPRALVHVYLRRSRACLETNDLFFSRDDRAIKLSTASLPLVKRFFTIKTIILPRQARDKYRKNSKKDCSARVRCTAVLDYVDALRLCVNSLADCVHEYAQLLLRSNHNTCIHYCILKF